MTAPERKQTLKALKNTPVASLCTDLIPNPLILSREVPSVRRTAAPEIDPSVRTAGEGGAKKSSSGSHCTGFHGDDTALPARAGELINLRKDQGKEERSRQFNDSILE